jgi:hypothetical protein
MADREQVEGTLVLRTGAPEGVVLVTAAAGAPLTASGQHPDKAQQTISLAVRYRHELP